VEHLGERLRAAREAHGYSLREMEQRTKIPVTALEAIERGDLSRLPGGIFGRSFIRSYAREVGFDPDETVSEFHRALAQEEREAAERTARLRLPLSQDDRQFLERQRRALRALQVGALLVVALVATLVTWQVRAWLNATPEPAEAAPVVPTTVIVPPAPADPVPTAVTPRSAELIVEFDIVDDTWLEVTVDGGTPITRLYRSGEQYRVGATREVLLDASNAGALQLTIDGRRATPLGSVGQRVRTRITPENAGEFTGATAEPDEVPGGGDDEPR
jgi:cytoskeleton protein RodZ